MNKLQLKALMSVNLRLVNPQVTDRYRKKGASGKTLTNKLIRQFFINALVYFLIFGLTMLTIDFSKMPGMFTYYIALFVLLGFSTSISGIYNIFFVGKDLADYLPLPFREQEIFLSKTLIVVFNTLPFFLPLMIVLMATGIRTGMFFLISVAVGLIIFLILLAIILCICSLLVFGLTKTKVFREHQDSVMNVFMVVTLVIAIGGIVLMNNINNSDSGKIVDHPAIKMFLPLYQIFKHPLSMVSGFTWLSLIGLLLVFGGLVKYFVLPHMIEQITQVNTSNHHNVKKRSNNHSLGHILDRYNLGLLKEPNLLVQIFTNSIMAPLIFIIVFLFTGSSLSLQVLSLKWFGVLFVGGIVFSTLTVNSTALIGNYISLDRNNYEFIQTLPFSFKKYLSRKFLIGYLFQLVVNIVMVLVVTIRLKVSLPLTVSAILGMALGTYLICQHYFIRDYRLRITDWTNVTQLFNRGSGNWGVTISIFVSVFFGAIAIGIYTALISGFPKSEIINLIVLLVIVVVSFLMERKYKLEFWDQLDS